MTPILPPQTQNIFGWGGGIGGVDRTYLNPFFDSLFMGFFLPQILYIISIYRWQGWEYFG